MDIFIGLSLLGYCLVIKRYTRWPIEAMPFFIVSLAIVLLYIFAYLNFLKTGSLLFIGIGECLLLAAPLYLFQEKNKLLSQYFTPGLVFYMIFLVVIAKFNYQFKVTNNDEINRWAPHIQFMHFYDRFWMVTDNLWDKDYPPAGALLSYLFLRLGEFNEGRFYLVQSFLMSTPFVILYKNFRWKDLGVALLIAYLVLNLFIGALNVKPFLLMDLPAGLFFGGILGSYFILSRQKQVIVYLLIPMCAFALFKPMLNPFIMLIGMIILLDQYFLMKQSNKKIISILPWLVLMIIPLLFYQTWDYYYHHIGGVPTRWGLEKLISEIQHFSNYQFDPVQLHIIILQFLKEIPYQFVLSILIATLIIYAMTINQTNKKRLLLSQTLLLIGFITYLSLLLLLFLFEFNPGMAMEMNSFSRFVSIYQVGWTFLMIAQALCFIEQPLLAAILCLPKKCRHLITLFFNHELINQAKFFSSAKKAILLGRYLLVFIMLNAFYNHTMTYKRQLRGRLSFNKNAEYLRTEIKKVTDPLKDLIGNDAKVDLVWGGFTTGVYVEYILTYDLFPRLTNATFSTDGNLGVDKTFETFAKQGDYMFIGYIEPGFWKRYGHYFKNRKPFKILSICANENFTDINGRDCVMTSLPVYLYKVQHEHGRVSFLNMA